LSNLQNDSTFKHSLIIALIGVIGVIIGALISAAPQFFSANKNEIIVNIDKIKDIHEKENKQVKPVFKLTNKEDGYISSVISCLIDIAELNKPTYLESQKLKEGNTIKKERIRSSINHELSENLHVSRIAQLENGVLVGISTKLRVISDFEEELKDEIFEVKNSVLINRPTNIMFIDIEHYLNKIGAYIINSKFGIVDEQQREVFTTIRYYPFKNSNRSKKFIDVTGYGTYYPNKKTNK